MNIIHRYGGIINTYIIKTAEQVTMKSKSVLIVFAILTAAGWYWFSDNKTTVSTREIITETVDHGDITRTVATSGSVRALVTAEVGSQLSGQIAELYADFNTPVKKDQLIALIDPQIFEKLCPTINC